MGERRLLFSLLLAVVIAYPVRGQVAFEQAVVNVGNVGLTVTNTGFIGRANVRNTPTGDPSFEYPLNSGAEHLFEAGLWVGAIRGDGTVTVRTGAVTASGGYVPGGTGYEFAPVSPFARRSSLPESDVFTRQATSHQDMTTAFVDTARVLPGTSIPMPDPEGRLGMKVIQTSYAWNFPFTEYFVIVNFDIVNMSTSPWDSVYVGLFHDLVVRNVNTNREAGSAFFNKNGIGFLDSLSANYAFNAGGTEETINTYGSLAFLGADWRDPATGNKRFFHPDLSDAYVADGYAAPMVNPRYWVFSGGTDDLSRPTADVDKYQRMSGLYPDPALYMSETEYLDAVAEWRERLRTDGQIAAGNWIGLTSAGPFDRVLPGDTLSVTFAAVAALKPDEFQGQPGKPVDTAESRRFLRNNLLWARRTYSGEDANFNGVMDPGEDSNNNGRLDRYRIPEPPSTPKMRVRFVRSTDPGTGRQQSKVELLWDKSAESSVDPVTGLQDFEGYRIYRSNPGDERGGNILDRATLMAQYDRPGNRTGFNNGFNEVALSEPIVLPDDTTKYWYRFQSADLLS